MQTILQTPSRPETCRNVLDLASTISPPSPHKEGVGFEVLKRFQGVSSPGTLTAPFFDSKSTTYYGEKKEHHSLCFIIDILCSLPFDGKLFQVC